MTIGHLVCHQMPDRSPHLFGVQLPLCWRCAGIVIGTVIFLALLFYRQQLVGFWLSLALAVLMPLDVFTAMAGLRPGLNSLRFVTGILWGIFGTTLVLHLIVWTLNRIQSRRDQAPKLDPGVTYAGG
jgi:uncharacterized membrane protein